MGGPLCQEPPRHPHKGNCRSTGGIHVACSSAPPLPGVYVAPNHGVDGCWVCPSILHHDVHRYRGQGARNPYRHSRVSLFLLFPSTAAY